VVSGIHLSYSLEADALKSPPTAVANGDPIRRSGRGQKTDAVRSPLSRRGPDGNEVESLAAGIAIPYSSSSSLPLLLRR
jgi:hypothetical protein